MNRRLSHEFPFTEIIQELTIIYNFAYPVQQIDVFPRMAVINTLYSTSPHRFQKAVSKVSLNVSSNNFISI